MTANNANSADAKNARLISMLCVLGIWNRLEDVIRM